MVGEEISTPVCVTVTNQEVDERCEEEAPNFQCYDKTCRPGVRTVYEKVCTPKQEQVAAQELVRILPRLNSCTLCFPFQTCQTVLDETSEEKCQTISRAKVLEECKTTMEEQCSEVIEYICQDMSDDVVHQQLSTGVTNKQTSVTPTVPQPSDSKEPPERRRDQV